MGVEGFAKFIYTQIINQMENYTIILFVLGVMVLLSALADKIKVASPIVLICTGIAIGFLPGMPGLAIDPRIIFLLFLPPLLYDAAFNIPFERFRANLSTISSLAIGLVFLTTAGIAVIVHYSIPGMSWPLSFVIGSILAATDAVAAISITKNLGLSPNTNVILEGESLINDASALVAYRFAVAAVTGVVFIWWRASLTFVVLMVGGFLVGMVMGKVLAYLLRAVRTHPMCVLSLTILTPFITYLLAETLHCSGVIAVVVLGFGISRLSAHRFPEHLRQQSKTIWEMIVFMLNGLIFILIGLEFPIVARAIDPHLFLPYAGYALLITLIALVLRMCRVFLQKGSLQRAFRSKKLAGSKRAIPESILLTVQESLIISWSGMRGIVSLAIAIALPATLDNGLPFPMRNDIVFISTVVVLITIVGQGLLLPVIIKRVRARYT
jgi:CPA1 family monovalent cation:H+ antiporter